MIPSTPPPRPPPTWLSWRTCREVTVEDNRASVRLGRQELEGRVRSLEASAEEEGKRHEKSLVEVVGERDAFEAEAKVLR